MLLYIYNYMCIYVGTFIKYIIIHINNVNINIVIPLTYTLHACAGAKERLHTTSGVLSG